jgi:hypothetical protein
MNTRTIGMIVLLLGLVCLVIGGVFIWQGFSVRGQIADGLLDEQITTGIPKEGDEGYDSNNKYVDTAAEAQAAHDTILSHMREDPGRYGDTERDSPERAAYVDGITLRNSLTIAVMGFGISTMALGIGVFMIITGVAFGGTGLVLRRQE